MTAHHSHKKSVVHDGVDKDRRDFLKQSSAAVAIAAATLSGAFAARTSTPPTPLNQQRILSDGPQFADYSLAAMQGKMVIATNGEDRALSLHAAFAALGGMAKFVTAGDIVLIKPNIAFASPARFSATTNPALLGALIDLCYEAGAAEVRVTDNPINDPDSCFRLSGTTDVVLKHKAKLVLPQAKLFSKFTLPDGKLIRDWPVLMKPFADVTKVFGVSPVKDHTRSGASLSMKNWYGLLGGRRNIFHQDISGIIVELATMLKPTAIVLDGITSMMTNGPTGGSTSDLKQTNTLIVSTDMVAADAYAAVELLGRELGSLPWIAKAQEAGVGTTDWQSLNPTILDMKTKGA